MIFNSGTHQKNLNGDIATVLSWVICSDFAAHTHANMGHHVCHVEMCFAWVIHAIFTFFVDVLIKISRTWCKKYHLWTLFWHFPCLTTKHTYGITSNHRHSPMIFNSGTHQENMIGDIDTVLSWVICSDFAAHTCKHGSSGLPRPNVFCSGEMLPFLKICV